MAGGAYYGETPDAPDDSYLWGSPPTTDTNFNWSWMNPDTNSTTPVGNNQNYTGNPFDPYSSVGTENTYIPGQGDTSIQNGGGLIPVNNDPNVIGSSTYDPLAGLTPDNNIPININDGLNMGGGMPGGSSGSGIFGGGNGGSVIPIPGINPLGALAASVLLSNGNIFGGGGGSGGLSGVANQVGNIVSNPVGSVNSSITNLGNSIMGPQPINGGTAAAAIPIAFPSSGNSNPEPPQTSNPTVTPPGPAPTNPTDAGNGKTIIAPGLPPTTNPVTNTDNSAPKVTIAPGLPPAQPPGPAPVNPIGTDNGPPPTLVTPTPVTPPGPAPTNPSPITGTDTGNTPTTVVTPITPPTTGGSTTTNPTVTTVPSTTVPDTSVVSPLDRNFYNEGSQSTSDLQRLLGGIAGLYGNASGSAGQTDFTNFQNILSKFGGANSNLTGLANDQTQAANTALRTNNLNDVQNLLPQATAIRNAANPGLLGDSGSLQNYSNGAASFLQQAQQQQNDANYLSPQEMNTAQQSARNAWSARGLVNSPGAVGAEILNTDSALRARQQQAFTNTQSALGTYGQSVNAQQQNQFDPFGAILGAQYGNQTNNAGSNANLYGQSSAFSSGANGNQYAQQISNPFNPYAADVYGSNYNAANSRNISASNNAAAAAGANSAQSSALANSFLRLFGQAATSSGGLGGLFCWCARSVFTEENPKWIMFRHWMLTKAPVWFRELYIAQGEETADWIESHAEIKPALEAWMNDMISTLNWETS